MSARNAPGARIPASERSPELVERPRSSENISFESGQRSGAPCVSMTSIRGWESAPRKPQISSLRIVSAKKTRGMHANRSECVGPRWRANKLPVRRKLAITSASGRTAKKREMASACRLGLKRSHARRGRTRCPTVAIGKHPRSRAYPLATPIGSSRVTMREMPASCTLATTAETSL